MGKVMRTISYEQVRDALEDVRADFLGEDQAISKAEDDELTRIANELANLWAAAEEGAGQ